MDDRPERKYLERHVREDLCSACATNPEIWKDLGRELIPKSDAALGGITASAKGDVITCCSKLFELWLQRQPEASWRQLIEALKEVKLTTLAVEIQEKLEPGIAYVCVHACMRVCACV